MSPGSPGDARVTDSPAFDALSRIRVVLSRPSHPGNIGSAARAMKTMGLSQLLLVQPRRAIDDEARALATNGLDVLESARTVDSLEEAIGGCVLAVAFTARTRELSHAPADVRTAAGEGVAAALKGDGVALVFGNETAGLSNHDVLLCNRLAHIPCDPQHGSLNLAAAVQVAVYEARMAAIAASGRAAVRPREPELAKLEDLEQLYRHFESSLGQTGFLDPGKPKRLMERLRRLFGRAQLEREELNILRGMLTAWDETLARQGTRPPKVD
jgi:tRNA/rRNA methyltransferase